jgi:hypothetical protein
MHPSMSRRSAGAAFLMVLGICISGAVSAQDQVKWISQFGTPAVDHAVDVSMDSGGIYIVGETDGIFPGEPDFGSRDAYVRKLDTTGVLLWTRQLGSAGFDVTRGVAAHSTGIYVSGHSNGALTAEVRRQWHASLDAAVRDNCRRHRVKGRSK